MNHARGARVNKPMCFEFIQVLIISVYKDLAYITAIMRSEKDFPRNENIKTKLKYIVSISHSIKVDKSKFTCPI